MTDYPEWFTPYTLPEKPKDFAFDPIETKTYTIDRESVRLGDLVAEYGENATLDMYNVGYSYEPEYVLEVTVKREKTQDDYAAEIRAHNVAMDRWAARQDSWDGYYASWQKDMAHLRKQVKRMQERLIARPL